MKQEDFFTWLDKGPLATNGEKLYEGFQICPKGVKFHLLDSKECGEGDWAGEEYKVYLVTTSDGKKTRIKLKGFYKSYDYDTNYVGWEVVQRVTKEVTFWEKKQ